MLVVMFPIVFPDAHRCGMLHGFGCLVHSRLSVELRVDLSHDLLPEWDIDKHREGQAEICYGCREGESFDH